MAASLVVGRVVAITCACLQATTLLSGCATTRPAERGAQPTAAAEPRPSSPPVDAPSPETEVDAAPTGEAFGDKRFASRVPDGFFRNDAALNERFSGVVLTRLERAPSSDSFLGSIVVMHIGYQTADQRFDLTQFAACRTNVQALGVQLQHDHGVDPEISDVSVVALPAGRACQGTLEVAAARHPHVVVASVMQSTGGDYMVLCSSAPGDKVAKEGCQAVLTQWRWSDEG
jgi:hypothetical protein